MKHTGPWVVFGVVVLGAFMAQLDLFIVNIAFPAISSDFSSAGDSVLSWILNGYAIVFAACLVPAGRLADLIGRRRTFELGIVVFAVGSAACAAAPDAGVLIGARLLQAVGAGMVVPTSLGITLAAFAPAQRAGATGAWAAGTAIAATLGPPLGGVLILLSWRWIFIVNLPVAVIALVGSRVLVPADEGHRDGGLPDMLGAALLVAGVTGLVLAIVEGQSWGWGSAAFVLVLIASGAVLAAFLRRCATHTAPIVELSLLRVRPFAASNAAIFGFSVAFGAGLLLAVLFLTGRWHERPVVAGLMIAPGPGLAFLLSPNMKHVITRVGARAVALLGCLCVAFTGVWLATHAHPQHDYVGVFLPAFISIGLGVGMVQPAVFGTVAGVLPPNRLSTGSGVLNMVRQIALAVGVAGAVAFLGAGQTVTDFHRAWWFMAVAAFVSAIATLALPGRLAASGSAAAAGSPAALAG